MIDIYLLDNRGRNLNFNIARRTLSSVLCDNIPMVKGSWLKLQENAFKVDSEKKTCEDILKTTSLDLEEIAEEIVKSLGKEHIYN